MGGFFELARPVAYVLAVHLLQCLDTFCVICKANKPVSFRFVLFIVFHDSAFRIARKLVEGLSQDVFIHLHRSVLQNTPEGYQLPAMAEGTGRKISSRFRKYRLDRVQPSCARHWHRVDWMCNKQAHLWPQVSYKNSEIVCWPNIHFVINPRLPTRSSKNSFLWLLFPLTILFL